MKTAKSKSIDEYVGSRMRAGRLSLNMSQEVLAQALGISFQQIQHYEKGINGVSAVRLFDICKILNVSLSSMFQAHSVCHGENARLVLQPAMPAYAADAVTEAIGASNAYTKPVDS